MLHEKYPECKIYWQDALDREQPRFSGDTYSYTFNIPIIHVIHYKHKDSIPDLSSEEKILLWVNQQPELIVKLNKVQIPAEKVSWNLKIGYANNKAGKRTPAVLVKGMCTVLCVLKPLTEEGKSAIGNSEPFIPEISDTTYYYTLKGINRSDKLLAKN